MKVDMNRLMGTGWVEEHQERPAKKKHTGLYKAVKTAVCLAIFLMFLGSSVVYQEWYKNNNVSAGQLYDETGLNPSFTVQHVGDVQAIDIQPGAGDIAVAGGSHASLNSDGTVATFTKQADLYEGYATTWQETDSIAAASFLNGEDGSQAEGYMLSEIWFGRDAGSNDRLDFTVLTVPNTDGIADLNCISLTNNPAHPGLSGISDGCYVPDGDGNFTVCIKDGDVVRLVFTLVGDTEENGADVFDYDISNGGYYKKKDYADRGRLYKTSGQEKETGKIYVDTLENGIHAAENYDGDGPKFTFGPDTGLDSVKGLTEGVSPDGSLLWSGKFFHIDLFGREPKAGRTDYTDGEYPFTFIRNGFTRTLSAAGDAEGLESFGNKFWILDTAPSYGTDGHDPVWGDGSENALYYTDGGVETFPAKDDGVCHNSFFGFSYTEDFTLSPGYTGALEFFGYSDDDMWVYAGQVDADGSVLTDTVVPVAALNGTAGYCNLWDSIDKVPYGEEAENWRLFVYWLERDGLSAGCYMDFTLPEAAIVDVQEPCQAVIEACGPASEEGQMRTFVFDDGTHNKYPAAYGGNEHMVVTSGQAFDLPSGSSLAVEGLAPGSGFTVTETNAAAVWASKDGSYEETGTLSGMAGEDARMSFVSAANKGSVTVMADAKGTPEGGYKIRLSLDGIKSMEIPAMDGHDSLAKSLVTDENGEAVLTLAAGESLKLYNLPDGAAFTLEPEDVPGWHVVEAHIDNVSADGSRVGGIINGDAPAYVIYGYEQNE